MSLNKHIPLYFSYTLLPGLICPIIVLCNFNLLINQQLSGKFKKKKKKKKNPLTFTFATDPNDRCNLISPGIVSDIYSSGFKKAWWTAGTR